MHSRIQKFIVKLFLLIGIVCCPLLAENPNLISAHRQGVPLPDSLLHRPESYRTQDQFYREYFSKSDTKIRQTYINQWEYNDRQKPWNLMEVGDRRFSSTGLENYRDQREEPLRKEFALQTLRLRLDEALNVQLRKLTFRNLNQAHQSFKAVVDSIQNIPIPLGKPSSAGKGQTAKTKPGEFRIGYDVLSDHSKIEYVKGWVDVGMYHPSLVGALTGTKDKLSLISMSLSSNFSNEYPKATLSYPLNLMNITATMSKPISRALDSVLVSSYPIREAGGTSRLELRLSYRF